MLKHCRRCGAIKLWFRFYTRFLSIYTWAPDLCKTCAGDIAYLAIVKEYNMFAQARTKEAE